jgi:hypothetical protein
MNNEQIKNTKLKRWEKMKRNVILGLAILATQSAIGSEQAQKFTSVVPNASSPFTVPALALGAISNFTSSSAAVGSDSTCASDTSSETSTPVFTYSHTMTPAPTPATTPMAKPSSQPYGHARVDSQDAWVTLHASANFSANKKKQGDEKKSNADKKTSAAAHAKQNNGHSSKKPKAAAAVKK